MKNKAKIISFSSHRSFGRTQEEVLVTIEKKLNEIHKLSPDLVSFPEQVLISTGDMRNPNWAENNAAALNLMQRKAKELNANIVTNLEEPAPAYDGKRYNTTYVIGRSGEILGKYRKRYITFRAIANGGLAGEKSVVVDTDIGKIGLAVCFDLGWRDEWQKLADMGADIVVWNSAYHGGNLLNAYAAVHMFYIVSSVWSNNSRIIGPMGDNIAESNVLDPFVTADIYPTSELFHSDHNFTLIPQLREEYGDRISIRFDANGNIFQIGVNDPTLSVAEVKEKFGMRNYIDYHKQSGADNDELRERYPEK